MNLFPDLTPIRRFLWKCIQWFTVANIGALTQEILSSKPANGSMTIYYNIYKFLMDISIDLSTDYSSIK